MNQYEIEQAADVLYAGGWRSEDREQLKIEYGFLDDEELDALCKALAEQEDA